MNLRSISHAFAALLSVGLLASCGDSSSSGAPDSWDGTWVHTDSDGFRQTYVFQGDQAHYTSTLHSCVVSESWGDFSISNSLLRITPDSTYIRSYSDNSVDSASTCAAERSKVEITGTMPLQLESISKTSFTVISHKISMVNNQSSSTTIKLVFQKQ